MNIPLLNTFSFKLLRGRVTKKQLQQLNLVVAALSALQAVIILALSHSAKSSVAVTTGYLSQDKLAESTTGHPVLSAASHTLFNVNLAYIVAGFLLISALASFLSATYRRRHYEVELRKGFSKARSLEYIFAGGLMMITLVLLGGFYDLSGLLLVFGLTVLAAVIEYLLVSQTGKEASWFGLRLGIAAGSLPWLAILIYMIGSLIWGSGLPTYVYFVYGSLLILSRAVVVNTVLSYKKIGKWSDYLYAERGYLILVFVAEAALAWQVFAGTLR